MRHGLCSTCAAALLGAVLSAGPVRAQQAPGWVDPPAKTGTEGKAPVKPAASGEASAPAAKPDPATAEVKSNGDTPAEKKTAGPAHGIHHGTREATAEDRPSRRAPRRLSRVPAVSQTPAMASGPSDARFPEWAATAQRLTDDYIDGVSGRGESIVSAAPRFYGERVRFHGRTLSLAAVLAEKRRFARRWPERRYVAQGGTMRTACSAGSATCIVRTTLDYRAESPARGARSQGTAELVLEVAFPAGRPVIVAESSRVLRRTAPGPMSAAPRPQNGA